MKKMSVAEYRRRVYKEVLCPSGMTWKIRKMPATILLETIALIPPGSPVDSPDDVSTNPEFREQLPGLLMKVIPACCVKPKVTLDPEGGDDKTA